MKIPRDVSASDLVKALRVLGYQFVRQDGSHVRLTTELNGKHHVTIPNHKTLKTGTLIKGVLNTGRGTSQSRDGGSRRETQSVSSSVLNPARVYFPTKTLLKCNFARFKSNRVFTR